MAINVVIFGHFKFKSERMWLVLWRKNHGADLYRTGELDDYHWDYHTLGIQSGWWFGTFYIPSGKLTWLWKITIFIGKSHSKWPCSIAILA